MRILKEKRKERGNANDFGGLIIPRPGFNQDSFCEPSIAPGFNRGIGGLEDWRIGGLEDSGDGNFSEYFIIRNGLKPIPID